MKMTESRQRFLKAFIVLLTLFNAVSSEDGSVRYRNGHTSKRDVQVDTTPNCTADTLITADERINLKTHYDSPKSNFSAERKRISETKCDEYIRELKSPYIIGGNDTESGEFPHMGAIGWNASSPSDTWIFKCGGSLISSKFVLTAAHCSRVSEHDETVVDVVPKIVRLGVKNIIVWENNPTDANIMKIILHPNYKYPMTYYDIALMELENHVTFSKYIYPACLWTSFETSPLVTEANVTGWGIVKARAFNVYDNSKITQFKPHDVGEIIQLDQAGSAELQVVLVDFIDSETCDRLLDHIWSRKWCGLIDNQICAGKLAGGMDACKGDSGGPLQVKITLPIATEGSMHYVVGVTSFGFHCALPRSPGVYSRVSTFLDWIESIVWSS